MERASDVRAAGPLLFPGSPRASDFTVDRMRWLIQLRWGAMVGSFVGTTLAVAGVIPGAAWRLMAPTVAFGCLYNFLLWRAHRAGVPPAGIRSALAQALIDLLMLTLLLWAVGGIDSPFVSFYVFHVSLIAIFGGPRWTAIATLASFAGVGFLALPGSLSALRIGVWNPIAPFGVVFEVVAFVATVSGAAYIVTHAARQLRDRERALARARDRAALEYQLLSNTLDELEAGLEVVDAEGRVLWRNKRAEELAPAQAERWECPGEHRACEQDVSGVCPVAQARDGGAPGRCRFAAPGNVGGQERVYEMMVFPIDESPRPRVMNLYVDRTHAMLAERQLLLAERLASLGRVAQGVAHELNTPLATIRTLATDMRHAIAELPGDAEVVADLDESALLIRDETRRLGRITQALLAGGDLVRGRIEGRVPLSSVVERAQAIVYAGARGDIEIEVDNAVAELEVAADMDRLVQILVNLFQNARDAVRTVGGGAVRVRAERRGDDVILRVEDEGAGLAPEMEGRLFEPFATTKPIGEGTGLGLYTSYMLVQAMGGSLALRNRDEGGAVAELVLPVAQSPDIPTGRLRRAERRPEAS